MTHTKESTYQRFEKEFPLKLEYTHANGRPDEVLTYKQIPAPESILSFIESEKEIAREEVRGEMRDKIEPMMWENKSGHLLHQGYYQSAIRDVLDLLSPKSKVNEI